MTKENNSWMRLLVFSLCNKHAHVLDVVFVCLKYLCLLWKKNTNNCVHKMKTQWIPFGQQQLLAALVLCTVCVSIHVVPQPPPADCYQPPALTPPPSLPLSPPHRASSRTRTARSTSTRSQSSRRCQRFPRGSSSSTRTSLAKRTSRSSRTLAGWGRRRHPPGWRFTVANV